MGMNVHGGFPFLFVSLKSKVKRGLKSHKNPVLSTFFAGGGGGNLLQIGYHRCFREEGPGRSLPPEWGRRSLFHKSKKCSKLNTFSDKKAISGSKSVLNFRSNSIIFIVFVTYDSNSNTQVGPQARIE